MIISVASGKGGTGKTLVATSLALSLQNEREVQFLDCDVEEPNAHIFLKPALNHKQAVSVPVPSIDEKKCNYCGKCAEVCAYNAIAVIKEKVLVFPELCHGCGACSYLCPEGAISEVKKEIGILEMGHSNGIEFIHGKLILEWLPADDLILFTGNADEGKSHDPIKPNDPLVYNDIVTIHADGPPGKLLCPIVSSDFVWQVIHGIWNYLYLFIYGKYSMRPESGFLDLGSVSGSHPHMCKLTV